MCSGGAVAVAVGSGGDVAGSDAVLVLVEGRAQGLGLGDRDGIPMVRGLQMQNMPIIPC